jgi:tetratricopeptide (TPR) repeat protein
VDDPLALATCWLSWGCACREQADYEEAHDHLTRSLDLYRQHSDLSGVASVQLHLARLALERSNYAEASFLLADDQRIREALQDNRGLAEVYLQQARLACYQGDFTGAEQLAQQALTVQQQLNDKANGILSLQLLAEIALHNTIDVTHADRYCTQALTWCAELHHASLRAAVMCTLAEVQRLRSQSEAARHTAEECLQWFKQMGMRKLEARALYQLSVLAADRGDMNAATQNGTLSLALCRQIHDERGLIDAAYHLGEVYARLQQVDRAREVRTEALVMAESLQHPLLDTLRQHLKA